MRVCSGGGGFPSVGRPRMFISLLDSRRITTMCELSECVTNEHYSVSGTHPAELDNLYLMLDQQYHPIPPDETCPQSVQIFEEHKQLAQEYLKVQTEITFLTRHMQELAERLSQDEIMCDEGVEEDDEEIKKLENEKETLTQMHQNLKKQLEMIHRKNSNEEKPSS